MIPPLDSDGYLPPGIHRATVEEIKARFGHESELRRVLMESLLWLVEAGPARAFSESLSTAVLSPTNWNRMTLICALLVGVGFPRMKPPRRTY